MYVASHSPILVYIVNGISNLLADPFYYLPSCEARINARCDNKKARPSAKSLFNVANYVLAQQNLLHIASNIINTKN